MNSYFGLTLILGILSVSYLGVESQVCKSEFANYEGTCLAVDRCKGAALPGNCANKNTVCCVNDVQSTKTGEDKWISRDIFYKIVGETERNKALYGYFYESMGLAQISNEYQAAAYLSQLAGETDNFKTMVSPKLEKDFNDDIGNNQANDGFRYKGRGAILLRGRGNYNDADKANLRKCLLNF